MDCLLGLPCLTDITLKGVRLEAEGREYFPGGIILS